MASLYRLNLSSLLQGGAWRALLEELPPRRRDRALACRREADAARTAAAGWLLRHALTLAGIPPEEQVFTENDWGKPRLTGRDRPQFSLSHSGVWALCAVGDSPMGVDIELPRCTLSMARRFFHPAEAAFVQSLPPQRQPEALCRLWVAKEAFLKAEGVGLHRPLSSFCVRLTGEGAALEDSPFSAPYRLHEYCLGAYRVCLCTREGRPELTAVPPPAL